MKRDSNQVKTSTNQSTIVDILKHRARATPDKVAYIYLEDGENQEKPITYGELDLLARRVAATIQSRVPNAYDSRVLLIYPQGLEFLVAFFGSLYAGATAVLVYPPTNKKIAKRLNEIASDADVSLVLSTTDVIEKMRHMSAQPAGVTNANVVDAGQRLEKLSQLEWLNTTSLNPGEENNFTVQKINGAHIAFLQYTSGSTGTPKGVMVSHDNVIANQKSIQSIFESTSESVTVGWLPLIHDMGLIGNALHPLFLGAPLVFMSPLHFMQKPVRWLRAISKYRAALSGGPNFAYELCLNKIRGSDLNEIDLSCWRVAFNGAEPVRAQTVSRFMQTFAAQGLSPNAHKAVYGLAEATLIVTGTRSQALHSADPASGYMSSGCSNHEDTVKVVNIDTGREQAEGQEGEIWVSGPSVAQGYWSRADATEETFRAKIPDCDQYFLRTGDMGYLKEGGLHITGRIKDIIIDQGRNFHAEDIEWSVHDHPAIRSGCVATFSLDQEDKEKLILVAGANTTRTDTLEQAVDQIRATIYADYQLQLDRIVFIRPKDMPLTTSGKVQRRLTRKLLIEGTFKTLLDKELSKHRACKANVEKRSTPFVAPSTNEERALAKTWSDILNLPVTDIGINDNFFELGGSSLTMLELSAQLNTSMELLFRYPTISGYLYRTSEYEYPDVDSDIYLHPSAIDESLQGRTGISLITGGTGFFGLHFLQSMLARTSDTFVLLVRGSSQEAIQKKFDQAIAYFDMTRRVDRSRVILIRGDLSQPKVGIPDDKYEWVANNVDRIYHIGSHVNNWLPYEGIREINVDGTRNLIQLARTGRKKEFHYASTSTFSPRKDDPSVFFESDDIDPTEINRYFGYDISKYASESMCKLARNEGLDCNIYRLVWVGGHLETGLTKLNDGLNIMLRILLTLGVYPQGNYLHDIVPVDLMADAMASIQGKALNTDYNVTSQSKESIDMRRIAVMLKSMGYDLKEVSRAELVERLKTYPAEKWDEHCKSYRQLVIRLFEDPVPKLESLYDSANFRAQVDPLVAARMEEKFIDAWFEKTVNYLVRNNALPTPGGKQYQAEIERISQWNGTGSVFPEDQCMHDIFDAQATATPDAVAVRHSSGEMTYASLALRANSIARHLAERGVKPGQLVGLSMTRTPQMIASILGIMKAGCAYVPLDPTYPAATLDYMIEDSGVACILVDHHSSERLHHHDQKLQSVESISTSNKTDSAYIMPLAAPTDLAYVIYTSGTTGQPKGVMVEHRSVVNHSCSMRSAFGLTYRDRVLQFSTVNFDSFVEEVFPTLFSGAAVVLVDQEALTDINKLSEVVKTNEVSVVKCSTAYWHEICELSLSKLGVRLLAIGGEAADAQKYKVWRACNPGVPLINTYGPTETTVTVTYSVLNDKTEHVTIGRPIANTKAYVLDTARNLVPPGVVGELYIGGTGVSRGYLNKPALTDEVFIASPLAAGERIYRTGDLVRWNQDGELEFVGRVDHQVKVRGYRIELSAIESVLGTFPGVHQAAVVVKAFNARKKIVAYYSSETDQVQPSELRAYLESCLPGYMVPNLLVPLDKIPMCPNGKVDRLSLELLDISVANQVDYAQPTTSQEVKMVHLWEQQLNTSPVGLNDQFMDLGGHSLLAMSLVQEVNKQFDTNLSISELYEHATVSKLLAHIDRGSQEQISNLVKFPEYAGIKVNTTQLRPLFLVHGLGGHLASFYPLVRNLKQVLLEKHKLDISVYGLEASGLKDGQAHFKTLDEMVSAYIQLIQQTQPKGPYLIGGWSYGVSVAFHIAQELIRMGEEVEIFISIDAEAPNVPKDFNEFMSENNIISIDDLYDENVLDNLLSTFGSRFGFEANKQANAKEQFFKFLGYASNGSNDQVERYNKVAIANLFNARHFKPERINPRNTVLVRASSSQFDNYMNDWVELVDSKVLSAVTLNGDHWSIMQDPELAEQLARCVVSGIEPEKSSSGPLH